MKKQNLTNLVKKDGKTFTLANINALEELCDKKNLRNGEWWYEWRNSSEKECRYHGVTSTIGKIIDTKETRMANFLTACGVSFTRGNDAPRGGQAGRYLAIKASDVKSIIRCIEKYCEVKKDGNIIFSVTIK